MSESPTALGNAAWVRIDTSLAPPMLVAFCADLERLYRINPQLEIRRWDALDERRLHAAFRNTGIGRDFELDIAVERTSAFEFVLRHSHGVKRATRFTIEATANGSALTITDEYAPEAGPDALDEVDRSLTAWGHALQGYLARERRWGRVPLWRAFMRRVWLPMKPSGRRIAAILVMVTMAELALVVMVAIVWWIENRG